MAKVSSLSVTILLLVFGSISLSSADSVSADKPEDYGLPSDRQSHKRDTVVDNAIGGIAEGSRIIAPDSYGKKTEVPKISGTQLSPITDTRVVAGAPAGGASVAGTAAAGNFPGGPSSGTLTGVNEGAASAGSGPGSGIETPSATDTGGLGGGGTTAGSGGGSLINVDANADLSSGSVDAGVNLDTNNTDKILDADLTAGAGEAGGAAGSADIAAGDLTADSGLPPETTESAISSQTDIGTEVDTSGGTVGGEADIGIEADVEGGTESDAVSDPADGLPAPGL